MRCAEVRRVLPVLAGGELHEAGDVEEHLAGCPGCRADLAAYRSVVVELGSLRDVVAEPSADFVERMMAAIPDARWREYLHRVVAKDRVQHAAFSLGGAVVGATAIGLLWWRAARRMTEAALPSAS